MGDNTHTRTSDSRRSALQRGKACIRCRRRKMRCDGARPICTPCIEASRVDDCEYTDNQGVTRTQMLEDNIARLESRLQELQGGPSSGQPLVLFDPYSTPVAKHDALPEPSAREKPLESGQLFQSLLSIFLPFGRVIGFALDPARIRHAASLPAPHTDRPHAALLDAICLWALRMSNTMENRQKEDFYLSRAVLALQQSSESRETHDSYRRVETVQAEILIAQYFFCLGHNIEGRYHANAAVTLALSCSLHQIRDFTESYQVSLSASLASSISLSPPRNAKERAERIGVFWAAFDLDCCWSAALEVPRSFPDDASQGTQIDTPWSEEVRAEIFGKTVQSFLSGYAIVDSDNSYSVFRSKASALYGRTTSLSGNPNGNNDYTVLEEDVQSLARITAELASVLPRLDELDAASSDVRLSMAATHALTHASMIHLYRTLAPVGSHGTPSAFLPHAEEIVAILDFTSKIIPRNNRHTESIVPDPILAVCGLTAGRAFVQECLRITHGPKTHEAVFRLRRLKGNIKRLINVLHVCAGFANQYPIFSHRAELIEEELPEDVLQGMHTEGLY